MNRYDLISVIVPVYKVEPYLDRCVQSIVDQTYTNLEIILVDDGSPDNCGAMCDAWAEKDSRIRVIHKENGGLSDARNAGMAVASGEYIAFVDSDDWVHTEYINYLFSACMTHRADISACDIQFIFGSDCAVDISEAPQSVSYTPEEAINTLLHGSVFRAVAWNKLFRRDLLMNETFPVGKLHEDEFFTYRILGKADSLAFVKEKLYFYFQRSGSIMSTFSIKHLDALEAYLERLNYLKERYPHLYVQDKVQFCISCAMCYREILKQEVAEAPQIRKRIVACRKQISFGFREVCGCNAKQLIYIMGTGFCMDKFCKFLNLRTGSKR